MKHLTTRNEVVQYIREHRTVVVFKAGTCRQTTEALKRIKPYIELRKDIAAGYIEVVDFREASAAAAELSGKKHETPQVLLFVDGSCVYAENHWRISVDGLHEAVVKFNT